jgi:hypothetical protein
MTGRSELLDVGVPQPNLHECHIRTGVQEMHRNRVTQRMKTPLGFRNRRDLAILLHQVPIGPAFQGDASGGDKEVGGVVLPTFKGVWHAAVNFALLPLLDIRPDQYPQLHRQSDDVSLSRLNHWLPGCETHPEVVQGTAEFHHQITDPLLPQAEPVLHDAAALDTPVDMLDPQPTLVKRLVRYLLRQGELRAA